MELIGRTLGGCRIDRLVGRGGMGEVYLATQLSLEREVAMKVLASIYAANEEFRERFKREARSIARVNHPHILQIYEVGEQDGVHYMVMEYIRGQNLAERLQQKGYIPWVEATGYIRQAADGLAAAAKARIIHRDVKPDNLMVTAEDVVKVSDFGLAKEYASTELTQSDAVMGTPAYMSPEQCDGHPPPDTRTDIYALGGSFYRMVTGILPFNAPSAMAMMYKHKHEAPTPPEQYMPDIPPELSALILRMMAKEMDERPQSMGDVVEAIDQILTSDPAAEADDEVETTLRVDRRDAFAFKPAESEQKADEPAGRGGGQVAELIAQGESYMAAGRPLAAFVCWQRALSQDPANDTLRERLEQAKQESTVASLQIAEEMLDAGNADRQRAELRDHIEAHPDDVDAVEKLQALEFMDARKRRVISDIRQKLSTSQYDEALELWESLHPSLRDRNLAGTIEHVRTHVLPLQRLCEEAEFLTKEGKFEAALEKWDEAAAIDPQNDHVLMGRQETERFLQRIERLLREAYEEELQNRPLAAVEIYDQILKIVPGHERAAKKQSACLRERAAWLEERGEDKTALEVWKTLLERFPDDAEAREHVDHLRGRLDQLNALAEEAGAALRNSRYSTAVRRYSEVLRRDASNETARRMLKKARRERFLRRRVPFGLTVMALVVIAALVPWLYRDILLERGDGLLGRDEYDRAVAYWVRAGEIPVWGDLAEDRIEARIARARLEQARDGIEAIRSTWRQSARSAEDLVALREGIGQLRQSVAAVDGTPGQERAEVLLQAYLTEAGALYQSDQLREAASLYDKARELAFEHELEIPAAHRGRPAGLAFYLKGRGAEEEGDLDAALRHYEEAYVKLPDFEEARERRQALLQAFRQRKDALRQAQTELQQGAGLRDFADAEPHLQRAVMLAEAILAEDPGRAGAEAVLREATWRLDAGADMVFFKLSDGRAFAIDRYEYPNRKGEVPQTATFFEARRIAGEIGKRLPTPDQWRLAAQGQATRTRRYPWGAAFEARRCHSSVGARRHKPAPSGSHPMGATPRGVHDLAGNLAEWVDRGEPEDADTAYAMGGHFATEDPDDLTSTSIEAIQNPGFSKRTTGFRCVKVYRADE